MRATYDPNSPLQAFLLEQDGRTFTFKGKEHTLQVRTHRAIYPYEYTAFNCVAWERNADCGWDLLDSENMLSIVSRWRGGTEALESQFLPDKG